MDRPANPQFLLEHASLTNKSDVADVLEKILLLLPDPLLVVDRKGLIIFVNLEAEREFGYTQEEMLSKNMEMLVPEPYRTRHAQHVQNYFQHPHTRPMASGLNLSAVRKNGTQFPVEISLGPIVLEDISFAMAIIRDVSERKKIEAKLDTLNQQLLNSAKCAGMAEVANSISHHLGNILSGVNISIEKLLDQTDQNTLINKLQNIAELIQTHAATLNDYFKTDEKGKLIPNFLTSVTKDLRNEHAQVKEEKERLKKQLDFAIDVLKMQNVMSMSSFFLEPTSPVEIINSAIKFCELHEIDVVTNYEIDNKFLINTDKMKLMQILICLLTNAKDSLMKCHHVVKRITIFIKKYNKNAMQIIIHDNGVGITADNLKRLFSFGFSTKYKHYGFGLHHSFLLAQELNGSLEASSEGEDKGATFVLMLPQIESPSAKPKNF